jgi:pyridoxamine 5'-phosphate oxidase family protein
MSAFTPAEREYLLSQRLGRLATVNAAGEPHVVPIAFAYNAELDTIDIGGFGMGRSKKLRDARRNPLVAFVVDDVQPEPRLVRGVEVRGRAEVLDTGGKALGARCDDEFIRIWPARIVAWGIDTDPYHPNSRRVGD